MNMKGSGVDSLNQQGRDAVSEEAPLTPRKPALRSGAGAGRRCRVAEARPDLHGFPIGSRTRVRTEPGQV